MFQDRRVKFSGVGCVCARHTLAGALARGPGRRCRGAGVRARACARGYTRVIRAPPAYS